MYQAPEQVVAFNKAGFEAAVKFAGVALQGAERILELQVRATRNAIAESVENAKAIAAVKDIQQLAALKDSLAQPAIEKATAYARSVYDVTAATQAEFGKLIEEQVAEFNKQVVATLDRMAKNAPAGSEAGIAAFKSGISAVNSAYDNFSKVAKQLAEATQSNLDAVAKQTANGVKKAKKAA
ncbi:MAG: phasin family protein [Burkholderiales bacterium]|nr:phasin family protein [Burkholderiales bacterium]